MGRRKIAILKGIYVQFTNENNRARAHGTAPGIIAVSLRMYSSQMPPYHGAYTATWDL